MTPPSKGNAQPPEGSVAGKGAPQLSQESLSGRNNPQASAEGSDEGKVALQPSAQGSAEGKGNPRQSVEGTAPGVAYTEAMASRNAGLREPYDPLKLCVYATVAFLAWLFGAWAVLGFAMLGFAGYWRARRAGLRRSKCLLRDTRLVLAYLGLIALVAVGALVWRYLPN